MFKPSLLALALVGVSAAHAADIETNTTPVAYSYEAEMSATKLAAGTIQVNLNAEYSPGDIITFTFSGGEFDSTSSPVLAFTPSAAESGDTMTLGLLSATSNTLVFRVTDVKDNGGTNGVITTGGNVKLAGVVFTKASVTSGFVSASYAAQTASGVAIDGGSKLSTAILGMGHVQEVGDDLVNFSGTIDVATNRRTFTGGGTTSTGGVDIDGIGSIKVGNKTVGYQRSYTLVKILETLHGDFSFIQDTDPDTDGIQPAAGVIKVHGLDISNFGDVEVTANAISFSDTNDGNDSVVINTDGDGDGKADAPLNPGKITHEGVLYFKDADGNTHNEQLFSDEPLGEWTLNGYTTFVNYMPFGTGLSQILYVSNGSSVDAVVTITAHIEGGKDVEIDGGSVNGGEIKQLAGIVKAALDKEGFTSGKASFDIYVSAPSSQVKVYASYKSNVDADRGFIQNQ